MTDTKGGRDLAEESRQAEWEGESFLRDLFMGRFRLSLLEAIDLEPAPTTRGAKFMHDLESLLSRVDPTEIDESGEYPDWLVRELAEIGAFGMKIPTDYGGLGLSHRDYMMAMSMLGAVDANVTALLSAHQAIGVPQPILLFGTEEQKRRFLPRCARGDISAFALTEPAVGSDPARIATRVRRDGDHFVIDGEKLWCTNGTLAKLIVVMARDADTDRISAFVVDTDTPGVEVLQRCHFMGLHALANAHLRFDGVTVPRDNLIGQEGDGLRIALQTLNTGRLTLPAATAGAAKRCVQITREWSSVRKQWGDAIGEHEAVALHNAWIARSAFAMEAVAHALGELADDEAYDIRLEAAAAKEWNTTRHWEMIDRTLQVRGGRGYETASSLASRGEPPIGVERMMRDARINRIFEGSSEIMHLFLAREALDQHIHVAERLIDPKATLGTKLAALPRIVGFYARWFPKLFFSWSLASVWPYGRFAGHLRFVDRASRRLARKLFYGMVRYRAALEEQQAFLFRAVDVGLELFAMTCGIVRARQLEQRGAPHRRQAARLADDYAWEARDRIETLLAGLFRNHDERFAATGRALLDGAHLHLEEGIPDLPYDAESLRPPTMEERLEESEAA